MQCIRDIHVLYREMKNWFGQEKVSFCFILILMMNCMVEVESSAVVIHPVGLRVSNVGKRVLQWICE